MFETALVCASITTLVLVAFCFIGLADGSISSFKMGLWFALLGVAGASLWISWTLYTNGRVKQALAALAVLALPGLMAALFMVLVLTTQARRS